ncbi:hypothetical protein BGZ57DRAFT_930063 [Hyaloscypha finlandica]|nr:hypothetical protein BGZ57DRAFT_930063 [Hyaloscypha finlandica]
MARMKERRAQLNQEKGLDRLNLTSLAISIAPIHVFQLAVPFRMHIFFFSLQMAKSGSIFHIRSESGDGVPKTADQVLFFDPAITDRPPHKHSAKPTPLKAT